MITVEEFSDSVLKNMAKEPLFCADATQNQPWFVKEVANHFMLPYYRGFGQ